MTSPSLVAGVRARNDEAWRRLVDLYGPLVASWCRSSGLGEADQADVVQEVFAAVARGIDRFRHGAAADTLRGWIATITRRKIIDHVRRIARDPAAHAVEASESLPQPSVPEGELIPPELARKFYRRALELVRPGVKESTWAAFWRTTVDGLPSTEVARELGMRPSSVRVAKARVLRRLREVLGDPGSDAS